MNLTSHSPKLVVGVVSLVTLLLSVLQAPADAQNTSGNLLSNQSALQEIARESRPVADKKQLQTRLRIPARRARVIFVGDTGKDRVNSFLATDSNETEFKCTSHGCSCHGDDDCNLMFTTVCKKRSTNGACTGEVCTCTP